MNREVSITGFGLITAIGKNSAENFMSLCQLKHGVAPLQGIDSIYKDDILVGEVKQSTQELKQLAQLSNIDSNSRGALMAIIATKEALAMAGLNKNELEACALISGTSVGGMELFEQGYKEFLQSEIQNAKYYFYEHDCGNINYKIASELKIKGYLGTISTACSSSANAILLGARMIKLGLVDRAIVGGSDALSKFTINGFNSLGILSKVHSQPFDEERKGLNLGEGAGYLVLEASSLCQNKKVYGKLSGYGNANDAFHQTASSDDGIGSKLAIKEALERARLLTSNIDYINTHGTGTPNNDFSESKAMLEIFGSTTLPPFNSLKPFTGHTLAACGSIEGAFSLMSIQEGLLFPSLNFNTPIASTGLKPVQELIKHDIHHVLSNSFGFGGNCTSLIFSK